MLVGFDIDFQGSDFSFMMKEKYYNSGKTIYDENKADIESILDEYIVDADSLSADKIMDDWFPQVNAQVFLSHSHLDKRSVIAFAGWLKEEAGITAFVDSCAWAYCDDLISKLDRKYRSGRDVAQINRVRAHVYMMLNSALLKMIDTTECLMFFNTPQSLVQSNFITGKPATYSPWIYSELLAANFLRRKSLEEHRNILIHEALFSGIKVQYQVCLDGLEKLDAQDISAWNEVVSKNMPVWRTAWDDTLAGEHALDKLYALKGLFEKGYKKSKVKKEIYG